MYFRTTWLPNGAAVYFSEKTYSCRVFSGHASLTSAWGDAKFSLAIFVDDHLGGLVHSFGIAAFGLSEFGVC